ncbi:Maltose/maltodextrin import ATP-binding protein MalK [Planctomycetes bacterium Pan216]|uniref:Maltose/maltodextrin import ATP-binding protein MalK n=1 Tax=Kolteria novifilia TaxID=2527975 RepID=A0A518B4X6_9BACT|nr:Maltose/maltodextrin import ATP-binding protein MalK [Planctomycetes bacterium Pan216]
MLRLDVSIRRRLTSTFSLEVSFATEAGVTSLFGPSGSGKTSILSAIAGLLPVDSGRIRFAERTWLDTTHHLVVSPERRSVGLVFQDDRLFPHMTVERNLLFGWKHRLDSPREISVDRVVEVLELAPLLKRSPNALSGGERQRVSLGRTLLRRPSLLLMDEPLAALDETLKSKILEYLERVLEEWRLPTIYVSHNQWEVRRLAEEVVVVDAGRVVDMGPTALTLSRQRQLALEGPLGPSNLLHVTHLRRDESGSWIGQCEGQTLHLPEPPAGKSDVWITFAPNTVSLSQTVPESSSIRNSLEGTVDHLVPLRDRVLVGVDVGIALWAEITREACEELQLGPGRQVRCLVKTRSFTLVH